VPVFSKAPPAQKVRPFTSPREKTLEDVDVLLDDASRRLAEALGGLAVQRDPRDDDDDDDDNLDSHLVLGRSRSARRYGDVVGRPFSGVAPFSPRRVADVVDFIHGKLAILAAIRRAMM